MVTSQQAQDDALRVARAVATGRLQGKVAADPGLKLASVRRTGSGVLILRAKFYEWRRRYGKANEHKIPCDHWIELWERTRMGSSLVPLPTATLNSSETPSRIPT